MKRQGGNYANNEISQKQKLTNSKIKLYVCELELAKN